MRQYIFATIATLPLMRLFWLTISSLKEHLLLHLAWKGVD
jgi:hypothetical protein